MLETAVAARRIVGHPIGPTSAALIAALSDAGLPTEDLDDGGGIFLAFESEGQTVAFGGFERYGDDVLLRSVVVLPAARSKGVGRTIIEAVLAQARDAGARRAYLFTTSAEAFFAQAGFARIERTAAPAAILATAQATTICSTAPLLTRPLHRDD